jgi:hypothetical protein
MHSVDAALNYVTKNYKRIAPGAELSTRTTTWVGLAAILSVYKQPKDYKIVLFPLFVAKPFLICSRLVFDLPSVHTTRIVNSTSDYTLDFVPLLLQGRKR